MTTEHTYKGYVIIIDNENGKYNFRVKTIAGDEIANSNQHNKPTGYHLNGDALMDAEQWILNYVDTAKWKEENQDKI